MSDPTPIEYRAQHVRDALTSDPRTLEQGIEVRIVGDTLYLEGVVGSAEHHDAIAEVAREQDPDLDIRNEVVVVEPDGIVPVEDLP